MEKRPRRTPAEKARAQYTNYAVKEPMELMEFLAAKMPDASRTKLKSLLSKRVVLVDNVITTQFNFPLQAGMKVQISKEKGKKEFHNRLLKIVYEDAYIIVVEKMQGLLSVNTERQKERTAYTILNEYVQRSGRQHRIFIVHRLDRDTSGLMMFAKDEKTQTFTAAYQEAYDGATPNQFAADAYDCVYAIKAAAEKENITPDMSASDICDALKKGMTEITYDGLTGKSITWSEDGEPTKDPTVVVVQNGEYQVLEAK